MRSARRGPPASWPDPARIRGLKQQLAASEAKNGKDHPDLVEILLRLGNAYRDEGGYVPATPYVERALSITEKTHGSEHLEVAATLDKLGTLYLAPGGHRPGPHGLHPGEACPSAGPG